MVKIPKAVVNVNPKNRSNLKNKNSSKKANVSKPPSKIKKVSTSRNPVKNAPKSTKTQTPTIPTELSKITKAERISLLKKNGWKRVGFTRNMSDVVKKLYGFNNAEYMGMKPIRKIKSLHSRYFIDTDGVINEYAGKTYKYSYNGFVFLIHDYGIEDGNPASVVVLSR